MCNSILSSGRCRPKPWQTSGNDDRGLCRVVIQPTEKGEVWLSPDLDDVLKLVYYNDFEKKDVESIMEAVQIKEGEPPAIELVTSP